MLLFLGMTISSSTGLYLGKQSIKPISSGNILYVGGSGPGNYSKIQDAINDSSDGDTVYVYNDSSPYYENAVVDKSIVLIGEDKNSTVINGGGIGDVIYVSVDNVEFSNFNIQNSGEDWFNDAGIQLHSSNTIIEENIIQNNNYGIFLKEYNGSNNLITNNDILFNDNTGIRFRWYFHNNTISDNLIFSNGIYGISIGSSNNNNILHNKIISNTYKGIVISHSKYNNIIGNNISDSIEEGIWLINTNNCYNYIIQNNISQNFFGIRNSEPSTNNNIYHNNFFDNTQNAYDECNNSWDNGYPSGGNYWDDYNGTDVDDDGIGDTPYNISGGDNRDRYPLMEPYGMGDENETFFGTLGPICPFLNIAEINLIDGNSSQIQKIEKMLNNRILQFIIPRWWYINVTELNFTISYNKKIPMMPFFFKFYYATMLIENENVTFFDKPHTVTVKGLNGIFTIIRGQPFRFRPPIFVFEGSTYDEVTIELQKGV